MKWLVLPLVVLMVAALLFLPEDGTTEDAAVLCHVGGTMTPVFEALIEAWHAGGGHPVEISSAGSGELMASIEMQKRGDLYVCHDPYMDVIIARGLATDAWYLAELRPVLVVRKGNPKHIRGLRDLTRDDVRLALTDREYSTLGHMLPLIFAKAGLDLAALCGRKQVPTHRSGSHVANLVGLGSVDAGVVWQAVAHLRRDRVEVIPIDPFLPEPGVDIITSATGRDYDIAPVKVTLIGLTCARHAAAARDFTAFVLGPQGRQIVQDFGYHLDDKAGRQEYRNGLQLRPQP